MKSVKNTLLFIFLCSVGFTYAQDEPETPKFQNEIGFEVLGFIDGQYQLTYERAINNHWTLGLGVGFKSESGLLNLSGLDTPSIQTDDLTYSGFKIIPEARYYLNNDGSSDMSGFYMGGFVKFSNFSSDVMGTYTDSSDEDFTVDFTTDINIMTIGFMVGYKLPLCERWSIDFTFAGPGAGFYNFKLKNNEPLPDSFYADLNDALSEYSIFDYLDPDFDFRVDGGKTNFGIISFRYSIKVNYAF